jgi:integrase
MARAKHGSYLFQRSGSENYYVKLRSPAGRVERSLGTSDRREAEVIAGPMITAHKASLLAARPRVETTWVREYEPGLHTGLEGERIYATATELHYLDAEGHAARIEPNGVLTRRLVGVGHPVPFSADREFRLFDAAQGERPKVPNKNGDDAILDTYLNHRNITEYDRREAETTWTLYKQLTDSKPLKDASRDDGRKLVAHFQELGNKRATIEKKLSWLRAAVELAMDEGKLKFNPFSNVVPRVDDELRRVPLNDADMKAAKQNLDNLSESDQLLFRVLATTGMRLSEAYQIDGELKENGVRYVIVGEKTEQSRRRVPLPSALLPFLPKAVKGPLFGENTRANHRAASKRFGRFLNECGIDDPSKVLHSLRHRAQDRLRAAGAPQDIREALLGHSKMTVGESYGAGFPVTMLKKWVDKIGF